MIKKILLISIVFSIFISCGKKGDPVYTDPDKKTQKPYTLNVIT